jgi:exosortase/archaeosortase family protein
MQLPSHHFPKKLEPYKGVIWFAIILMAANFFWKYDVMGDESSRFDSIVTFWGINISAPFVWMANHVTQVTYHLLKFMDFNISVQPANIVQHANGHSVQIIWACTGLKQAYIFFCIIAFYRGPWLKKLWFIPSGFLVVYAFNIFRIAFIVAIVGKHPEWFELLHLYLFKYLFYLIIFLMWVFWEEKIAGKSNKSIVQKKIPE